MSLFVVTGLTGSLCPVDQSDHSALSTITDWPLTHVPLLYYYHWVVLIVQWRNTKIPNTKNREKWVKNTLKHTDKSVSYLELEQTAVVGLLLMISVRSKWMFRVEMILHFNIINSSTDIREYNSGTIRLVLVSILNHSRNRLHGEHGTYYKITLACVSCLSVCLSPLLRSQFSFSFDETLHRSL